MKIKLALITFLSSVACAHPSSIQTASKSAPSSPPPRHVFRLDFTVTTLEGTKELSATHHSLNLEETHSAQLKVGSNIVLPPSNMRTDVGLDIWCDYKLVGEQLLMDEHTEISIAEGPSSIHKVSTSDQAVVTPGVSTLVSAIEEPTNHTRYQVSVIATKLL